jgi:YbbR domain-containing protein
LQVYGLNPDFSILKSPGNTVSVIATGTQEELAKFEELLAVTKNPATKGLVAVLDLSSASPEDIDQVYPVILPRNETIRQSGIRFKDAPEIPVVVVYQFRKPFEVHVDVTNVPEGFGVSDTKIEPQQIYVGGPRGDVNDITRLIGTADLRDYKPGRTYPVSIKAVDKDGNQITTVNLEDSSVIMTPTLSVAPPEKSILIDVQLSPGTSPARGYRLVSYSIDNPAVVVRGLTSALGSIRSIRTAPLDLTNLKSSQERTVPLMAPNGMTLATQSVKVRLVVEKIPIVSGKNP